MSEDNIIYSDMYDGDGKCGICGLVGRLGDVQQHFINEHIEVEGEIEPTETESESNYHNTSNSSHENQSTDAFGDVLSSPPQKENRAENTEWQEGETRLLLDKYEGYISLVGPMKKFKTKKSMWLQISNDLLTILKITRTPVQCENRYKTVLKRKKKAVDNNQTSGSSRFKIEFEDEMNKISSLDDSIEPDILRDSKQVKITQKKPASTPTSTEKRKEKSIQEVLLEIANTKEAARERRHKEKMDLLKKVLEDRKD